MIRPSTGVKSLEQSKLYETSKSFRIGSQKKFKRTAPIQMIHDSEFLYEENIRLKNEIQDLRFELKKERQDHQNFESLVAKQNESNNQFQLILNQRSKIKEYKKSIAEMEEQILALKREPLKTKFMEAETELDELRIEYKKLQLMFSGRINQNESSLGNLNATNMNILAQYKQDNMLLAQQISSLVQENQSLANQVKVNKLDKNKSILKQKDLEQQLEMVTKHLMFVRKENQNNKNQLTPNESLLKQIDEQRLVIEQFNKDSINHKKLIEEYEQKVNELTHNYDVLKAMENKEKDKLHDRINMLKKQIEDLQNKQQDSFEEGSIVSFNHLNQQQMTLVIPKRSLHKVNNYDIQDIISKLKLKLLSQNIEYISQEQALIQGFEDSITLDEVMNRLQQSPFELQGDELTLVARYLVEDNTEEHIYYDLQRTQTKAILKSVYKKLIGEYKLYDQEEKAEMSEFYEQLFNKYSSAMESAIKQCIIKKKHLQQGFCEMEDFNEALKYCDIVLSNRQRTYLDLVLYLDTQQIIKIQYMTLFKSFMERAKTPEL